MASHPLSQLPIRELFHKNVTRDIPPVVYLQDQTPAKLAEEVSEYIITGGWPEGHHNHRRVPNGIHEQYVRLLSAIADELDKPGGPELPNAWISGFYGSGKSSFAKLLGFALDGVALPDGRSLAQALLAADTSPRAAELHDAWGRLRAKIDPIAVVFDVGGVARTDEHIHAVAVRQVQARLGYSTHSAHVAFGELDVERDGRWKALEAAALETYGQPWSALSSTTQAQARFSNLMAKLYPDVYSDNRDWHLRHSGTTVHGLSPEEAITALRDMLRFRRPGATLFLVIDEVSQYVLAHADRVERLRAFASALGAGLRGKAWMFALGQQKMEEDADASFLVKTKDRFPPKLRVHLAATNIRDVVHKRLLHKRPEHLASLHALFDQHRADLKLYAYDCEAMSAEDFAEVYPLLPGHIDLLMSITSALRTRSPRAQGDDQAIRGLLQLLGELFRDQKLAERPVGALVTLDMVYEVQHTALDSDAQGSMARVLAQCADDTTGQLVRVAKAVALLELIQEHTPTTATLVAQCLYDRLDRGNHVAEITAALETLRRRNLLGYSEKSGYKLQSSAAEEWERERRDIHPTREVQAELVSDALKHLVAAAERPRLLGRPFPWTGLFSDGRHADDVTLVDARDDASLTVDFRHLDANERQPATWIKRSTEAALFDRLVWVCGDTDAVKEQCRELHRSRTMVSKNKPRRESLTAARKMLLQQEENRAEDLVVALRNAVSAAFMSGALYLRGGPFTPAQHGTTFVTTLHAIGQRVLPDLYPHFVATMVTPGELNQLLEPELTGPSPKFLGAELGILELDAGRYLPTCAGVVARRVQEHIETEGGVGGTSLLARFGGPPYGYAANVVKACVAGLLRGGKLRVQPESGGEITAVRDAGVRDLFDKDRAFRRASFFPAGDDDIGFQARARICKFFDTRLSQVVDREDHAIADAVSQHFPAQARRLRDVLTRLDQLPNRPKPPEPLARLQDVLEKCVAQSRHTRPTVNLLKHHLDALSDGLQLLNLFDAELTPETIAAVRHAVSVRDHQLAQLADVDALGDAHDAGARVREHLALDRPWRDIAALQADLTTLLSTYAEFRQHLMSLQELKVNEARSRIKTRQGFATLTADQSHHVLRPLTEAVTNTTAEAIAPSLAALRDPFELALQRAEALANERLDELLSDTKVIVRLALNLQNRELHTPADVDALLAEIRERLLRQIAEGSRVRLI